MDKHYEKLPLTPLVHGKMIYSCEQCGEIWPMYLEKGIEEFGENHKPSPFMIACPHCGGWAMDVSGIQKMPDEAYMVITGKAGYFANVEGKDCGVPVFPGQKTDEVDDFLQDEGMRFFIEDLAKQMGIEVEQEIEEAVRMVAEETDRPVESYSSDKAARALKIAMQALMEGLLCGCMDTDAYLAGKCAETVFIDCRTAWERKEAREKRRAVERETAVRFRQCKARERAWVTKKRTGARRREWRGPWKETKTNESKLKLNKPNY